MQVTYLVIIASELENLKDTRRCVLFFFFASLQRTFISFLSFSVMHSSLTYYRSVDCVSRCPLSRTLASVNTK